MEMAAGAIRIVDKYATADIKGRIEIILDNYPNFLEIMDGFEESLKYLILNDRRAARRRSMGDLGVRVQKTGISDPTANEAIDRVMLSEAIKTGNLDEELKGIECPEQYRREAEVIREMRNDYFLVRAQIKTLPWLNFKVLASYLNGSHDLLKLADETDCTYDGVKNRLKRARNRIRQSTAFYLEKKYENEYWREKA